MIFEVDLTLMNRYDEKIPILKLIKLILINKD